MNVQNGVNFNMDQLTIGDVLAFIRQLTDNGMSLKEIGELPIYIGNDDELNGIHCAWCTDFVDSESDNEDTQYLVDLINERRCNLKLDGKAILIS